MPTSVTQVTKPPDPGDFPAMSYTGVTTNRDMAQALLDRLLKVAEKMVPEKRWAIDDLLAVLRTAVDPRSGAAAMLEGKYLRRSLREQMALSDRYKETFSILVMAFDAKGDEGLQQSLIDAVIERLRKSDMVFLFRRRAVILLPRTDAAAAEKLMSRLRLLFSTAIGGDLAVAFRCRTYPAPDITSQDEILDWTEEQLR